MTAFAENLIAGQMTGFPRASERTELTERPKSYPCLPHLLSKSQILNCSGEDSTNPLWIDRRR